ncbi:hypothetical protein G6F46_000560 [Rhizopus delemar]|uniref:Uncharacterized protein n=2 Tax=Rhizopus TaxID=4842 RepID=A0A9P7CR44_9FUNG|nr:hypothetical protein G6F43_002922 [Rhizopus delemar]KAG1547959.1 hypothetical protein G6F51_003953 [Rhizopus arrhizus]KAG1464263.1 hypothetical protein G6F55_001888 [Rhizopus delemar]KAG1527756.1 hypothetical protein G6F52_001253 [Rhizopus delemar]KAG1557612.1 hypothetical protein G6F49_005241 [Rhizopus delemar]
MTLDEFQPEDDFLSEISHKLSNVSIHVLPATGELIEQSDLSTIKYLLYSSEHYKIKQSIEALRRYLSQDTRSNRVNDILSLDILPRIKELLALNPDHSIKFECAWIITNIAAGTKEQTDVIVQHEFVDVLFEMVNDRQYGLEVNYQSAWALANVAGESPSYREEMISRGLSDAIALILDEIFDEINDATYFVSGKMYISDKVYYAALDALLWSLANIARGGFRTAEHWEKYVYMFNILSKYIKLEIKKLEIEICWGISRILHNMYGVDVFYEKIRITTHLCNRLAAILGRGSTSRLVPAIRTVVNISSGPNYWIHGLIDAPILYSLTRLLEEQSYVDLKKDVFLVVSNMASINEDTVDHVLNHTIVMQHIIAHIRIPGHIYEDFRWVPSKSHACLKIDEEWRITKEATWILFNIITIGRDSSIKQLLRLHPTLPNELGYLLNYANLSTEICERVLESIISIVQRTNKYVDYRQYNKNPIVSLFLQERVPEMLNTVHDNYRSHKIKTLCAKLSKLLMASEEDINQTAAIVEAGNMADEFGLPSLEEIKSKSQKRRIIRGMEDGDVRWIENAVGGLNI